MTRQVKALGSSSSRPLLIHPLLILILSQRTGDIENGIRLYGREKDLCFFNNWLNPAELRWVRKVAQPGVDCCYLGSAPRSAKGLDKVKIGHNLGQDKDRKNYGTDE